MWAADIQFLKCALKILLTNFHDKKNQPYTNTAMVCVPFEPLVAPGQMLCDPSVCTVPPGSDYSL